MVTEYFYYENCEHAIELTEAEAREEDMHAGQILGSCGACREENRIEFIMPKGVTQFPPLFAMSGLVSTPYSMPYGGIVLSGVAVYTEEDEDISL